MVCPSQLKHLSYHTSVSGRLKSLSQKYRVSSDVRTEIKSERRNARLESLEDDNYSVVKNKADDEEFIPQEEDEGELTFNGSSNECGKNHNSIPLQSTTCWILFIS